MKTRQGRCGEGVRWMLRWAWAQSLIIQVGTDGSWVEWEGVAAVVHDADLGSGAGSRRVVVCVGLCKMESDSWCCGQSCCGLYDMCIWRCLGAYEWP